MQDVSEEISPVRTTIDELLRMGLHFGHHTSKWNPKMAPYIYTSRNGFDIIDVIMTYAHLKKVAAFLTESAAQGKTFLFVGTKRPSAALISKFALESGSFYVNQRWLGGMLTNWKTMRESVVTLRLLESQEKSSSFERLPKRERALHKKKRERLERYLGGVRQMYSPPDIVVIVGQQEEMNAVRECRKLSIQNVTLLDTDCDPTLADLFIPVNDDSISSLKFVLGWLARAIKKGRERITQDRDIPSLQKPLKMLEEVRAQGKGMPLLPKPLKMLEEVRTQGKGITLLPKPLKKVEEVRAQGKGPPKQQPLKKGREVRAQGKGSPKRV